MRRVGWLAAVTGGAVLLLSGCGEGSGGEGGTTATAEEDVYVSPMEPYTSAVVGGYDEELAAERSRQIEEILASCMREQGFDYTPVDWAAMDGRLSGSSVGDDVWSDYGTREWVEQWGYGAATMADLVQEEPAEPEDPAWQDPNEAYVDAMSDSEREAYYAALYGEQVYDEDDESTWEYDWTQGGCQGMAQHEVYGDEDARLSEAWQDPAYQALQEEMNTIYQNLETHPLVLTAVETWVQCMADAGYPGMVAVYDAQNEIYDELWELMPEDGSAPPAAALAELKAKELAVALADFDCAELADHDQAYRDAQYELESEFVEAHRAELEAWAAAYGTQG